MSSLLDQLRYTIQNHPVIDNHAHNLLQKTQADPDTFLTIVTEAQDDALRDASSALSHIKAAKQLKELYDCETDDWKALCGKREKIVANDFDDLVKKCLVGTHMVLIDDGLGDPQTVFPYGWHSSFTTEPAKRIVRIESIAENILRKDILPNYDPDDTIEPEKFSIYAEFMVAFDQAIVDAIKDREVAGFKSVICYRSGLDVTVGIPESKAIESFIGCITAFKTGEIVKLRNKTLNDLLVLRTMRKLSSTSGQRVKPIQFHTGLGDNDMNLVRANPAYLQPLIEQFPKVPVVLLHSAYPYIREAGYLATVFSNVYLDIGLVFPMVSPQGQERVLHQALELTPGDKLLWSTDGHLYPETYWLSNKQFRDTLEMVLLGMIEKGDVDVPQAQSLTQNILFNNSNKLYALKASAPDSKNLPLLGTETSETSQGNTELQALQRFERQNGPLSYVYVQWLDNMGTMRARILPIKEFRRIVSEGTRLGISRGNTGTLQNDTFTPAVNTAGQIYLNIDMSTLRLTHKFDKLRRPSKPSASVLCCLVDEGGAPLEVCPRGILASLSKELKDDFGIDLLVGFEIEIAFLRRSEEDKSYTPFTENHAWGTLTPEQWQAMDMIGEIVDALAEIGIEFQQFHSEAGQGQYEFILPPLPLFSAIATFIQTRTALQQMAHRHGLRATMHPHPLPTIGSGEHVHISLDPPDRALDFFVHGVTANLGSLCALTMPEMDSYLRVVDNCWTGGSWITWGTQNRETPIRRVKDDRWEYRSLDGCANIYIAMAGILAAGLVGLKGRTKSDCKDCQSNPSKLSDADRKAIGITQRLPKTLSESLSLLKENQNLIDHLGKTFVKDYLDMKEVEMQMLKDMGEEEARAWLIERY